jgi:phenylpropionate dioxygenase-like ring-hydroxylating dioxygenase large terminal subunit
MGWPGAWYVACRSTDLKRTPIAIVVAGERLVLFRGRGDGAHALEDRCAHRGAPLSAGCIEADALRCPYHGWLYDGSGRVREVPSLSSSAAVPDSACVRAYPSVETQGYVWVWTGTDTPNRTPHVFAHLDESGWSHFRMRTRFAASVETCLENFLDCPHASYVHRGWFRAPTGRPVKAIVRTLDDGAEAEYFDEPRTGSLVWRLLAPRSGGMKHTDRFIAPNVSQVDYAFPNGLHYTITSCCTPVAARETIVHTVISFRWGALGPLVRLVFEPLSRIIIRQDVRMIAMQRANLDRFGTSTFVSSDADLLGPLIGAWHHALRQGEAPPKAGSVRHVEMRI